MKKSTHRVCRMYIQKGFLLLAFGLLLPFTAAAEFNPPEGADDLDQLLSPRMLTIGSFGLMNEYPSANAVNPAAAAQVQRTHLDLSYLSGLEFSSGALDAGGHILNLGGVFPTPAGVLGGGLQFTFSELDSLQVGNLGRLYTSFSKQLYDNLSFGAGVEASVGYGNRWDGSITASFGVIHSLARLTDLKNARYGIAIAGMGKWFRGYTGNSPYPSPFTPSIEFAFSPVYNENILWDVYSQLEAPSFQNLRLQAGTEITIRERVSIHAGFDIDMRSLQRNPGDIGHYLPSIGLNIKIPTSLPSEEDTFLTERGWQQSEVNVRTGLSPVQGNTWIFGLGINAALGIIDESPPSVEIAGDDVVYISPNNDGIQDSLHFPVEITDERYIMGYRLIIRNQDGDVIRSIENVERRPESEGVRNVLDRLLSVTTGLPVPEELRWNGRTDDGARAEDGEYTFSVEAWDDNGNIGVSSVHTVVVDTQAPVIELDPPTGDGLIFSPSEESLQNSVEIGQTGSSEDLWIGEIVNDQDHVVRTYEWSNTSPDDFSWNGYDDNSEVVPDGVYSYRKWSQDRAGNSGSDGFTNIILNSEPTPVSLTISRSIFSPDDNGVNDTIRLVPDIGNTRGIRDWRLQVRNSRGTVVRTYQNAGVPRDAGIVFNGNGDNGRQLPEGSYTAELTVQYRNGNRPSATSPAFVIDVSPPVATVSVEHQIFSPNNSGIRDTQVFYQESSAETEWKGIIRDVHGRTVQEFTWYDTAVDQFIWDGRTSTGELASDGIYSYQLVSTDRAGNTGTSNQVEFELNTEETPVLVTTNYDAFSPTGTGNKDTISIIPNLKKQDEIEYFRFEIINPQTEEIIRSADGSDILTAPFVWDGRDQGGLPAPDGEYVARLEILYLNGNLEESVTDPFVLDTRAPQAEIAAEYLLFSPDGDNRRDTVPVSQQNLTDDFWMGSIQNSQGDTVREYRWGYDLEDFSWDGRDDDGNLVDDGIYRYIIRSEDNAGNRTEHSITDITVDTRPASVFATIDYPAIAPGQDLERSEQKINLFVNLVDGADEWRLDIINQNDRILRSFSGTDVESSFSVEWDGRDESGEINEGSFRARFMVDYQKGNQPQAVTRDFRIDVTPPQADIVLNPVPFSPDNDGIDDTLSIALNLSDASAIAEWRFEIQDRNNRPFHIIEGSGAPGSTLTWDGRSSITGETVISAENYPFVFTVSDILGNTAEYKGIIPIDILVIRDGDRLKVQIPSITFMPDSPVLVIDADTEVGQKNLSIVRRLVEIFTRYSSYSIQVEGHAVNISQTAREEREELQPLSLERAQAVKDALVEGGLSESRITAVGRGGMEPIVPHTDEDERWKNRRVEFILIR